MCLQKCIFNRFSVDRKCLIWHNARRLHSFGTRCQVCTQQQQHTLHFLNAAHWSHSQKVEKSTSQGTLTHTPAVSWSMIWLFTAEWLQEVADTWSVMHLYNTKWTGCTVCVRVCASPPNLYEEFLFRASEHSSSIKTVQVNEHCHSNLSSWYTQGSAKQCVSCLKLHGFNCRCISANLCILNLCIKTLKKQTDALPDLSHVSIVPERQYEAKQGFMSPFFLYHVSWCITRCVQMIS